jgi:hypothetical protein
VAAIGLSGCGSDEAPVSNAPGPAVYSAFSGVTIEINPTLSFLTNGQLTYLNTVAGSAFPAAANAITGTYTYTPAADYLSGTLAMNLPGLNQVLSMTFQSFTTQGGKVTGFTTVYNGQSYSSNVTGGTLTPAAVQGGTTNTGGSNSGSSNSGGSSTGSGTTVTTPVGTNEALAPDIPASMQGTYNLTYINVQTGSPITAGTQKTFVIGAKTLAFDNKTLTGPVHRNQNPYEWIFKDGDLEYAVSIATNNSLNEINVGKTGGTPWYGQFKETSGSGSTGSGTGTGNGVPSSSSGTGSGGSTSGNGTASFGSNGNFVAGTTFTHKVLSYTITPAGASAISSFPSFTVDESVTFTIGSDGSLQFKGYTLPFKAREGNFNLYQLTIAGSGATDNLIGTVALQPGDANARVVLSFGRATIALPPAITTFTYALD